MPNRPTVRKALEALLQTYYPRTGNPPPKHWPLTPAEEGTVRFFKRLARGVKRNPLLLGAVANEYRTPALCDLALKRSGLAIADIPPEHQTMERFLKAIKNNPDAIRYAPENLRPLLETKLAVDRMIGKKRFKRFSNLIENILDYFSPKLDPISKNLIRCMDILNGKNCEGLSKLQLKNELKENFSRLPDNLKITDFCKKAVKYNPACAAYVPDSESSAEIMRSLIKQSPAALENIPQTRRNSELCLIAYLKDKKTLALAPPALKTEIVVSAEKFEIEKNQIRNQEDLEKFISHWGAAVPEDFIRKQVNKFVSQGPQFEEIKKPINLSETISGNISNHLQKTGQAENLPPNVLLKP